MRDLKTILGKTFGLSKVEWLMGACAIASAGVHTPLNQGRHIVRPLGGRRGLCHGLSVQWLAAKRTHSLGGTSFVRQAQYFDRNATKMAAVQHSHNNQRYRGQVAGAQQQFEAMLAQNGLSYVGAKYYARSKSGLAQMGWEIISLKRNLHGRYFLIGTGRHAMAATSHLGTARFFDANGGEVVWGHAAGLTGFMLMYLLKSMFDTPYFGGICGNRIELIELA